MDKFYENLKRFQPYEVIASEHIKRYKNVEIVKFCNTNKFDFKDSNGDKYEVKTEPSSIKTGNYFIEFCIHLYKCILKCRKELCSNSIMR